MKQAVYTVSSLVHYLKLTIDNDMNVQSVLIKGEVSNFTNHRSGHWYFTLKDARSKLSCVMFSSYASRCNVLLKEGMQVIVNASLSVYEAQGSCQLYVTSVQVDGLGDLYLQYEQVKEKLYQEGLFASEHKKAIPTFPSSVAIISAKEGAALPDMYTTIARRWPLLKITFLPSLVQGKDAPKALIENLQKADQLGVDVILLARGGGAIEDLWCFNDEALARCVYQMKTVVVSGVGHETDTTLVDYVADARAATPTAAAQLITPDIEDVKSALVNEKKRMSQAMERKLQEANYQMRKMHEHRYLKDPISYIKEAQMNVAMHTKELQRVHQIVQTQRVNLSYQGQRLVMLSQNVQREARQAAHKQTQGLLTSMNQYQTAQHQQMAQVLQLLDAYSPLHVLKRGYSVVYQGDKLIKSIHDIKESDIRVRMQDGVLVAHVDHKEEM